MEIVSWSESYSVGVAEIDAQHKKLVSILNLLVSSMAQGAEKKVLSSILTDLAEYAGYHFDTEERYMEKFNFPGLESHRMEHQWFKTKVTTLLEADKNGEPVVAVELLEFLWEWLRKHILGVDQKFSACFRENGLR
ncbi:MAG: hemerythrin family protein [Candidatus Omnitrophica bacterium]|nr:hemerythrin family protein [Candidatus Omnitrophota bacterium]